MRKLAGEILERVWLSGLEPLTRFRWVDVVYTYVAFWFVLGRFPNTRRPMRFTDHLISLKLSSELGSPLRIHVTDKEHAKAYISDKLGNNYAVPTYAVLTSKRELEEYEFPQNCMIKPTHASGKRLMRVNGDPVDRDMLSSWLLHSHYGAHREENYRNLQPKIIVEQLLLFDGKLPLDYKIHCVFGRPKLIQVMSGVLNGRISSAIYSAAWEKLPIGIRVPAGLEVARPRNLEAIVKAAECLSKEFSYIRVDLYTDGERLYVGELTNLPAAGNMRFFPQDADRLAGVFFREPDADPVKVLQHWQISNV